MLTSEVRYAVVHPASGDITRTGACSQQSLALQGEEGMLLIYPIAEDVHDDTHYWAGHGFAVYPSPQPSPYHRWDGDAWIDARTQDDLAAELDAARLTALAQITRLRASASLAVAPTFPTKELRDIAKLREAEILLADPEPDPFEYPLLVSEIGVSGTTIYEVAQACLNLQFLWKHAAASIDAACFQAEAAVMQAPDAEAIAAILAALTAQITA